MIHKSTLSPYFRSYICRVLISENDNCQYTEVSTAYFPYTLLSVLEIFFPKAKQTAAIKIDNGDKAMFFTPGSRILIHVSQECLVCHTHTIVYRRQ